MRNDLHDLVSGWREKDLVYFAPLYNEYLQRETIWWNRNPGHQMSYKEDRDWSIFAHAVLNAIRNPSSTVSFEVRSSAMQTNNQTNKNKYNNNNLDTFVKKKGFFMEKLSARGYNDAELSKADSSINFEDRKHFIKEKFKSTAIPLVFNTKYNRNFAGKYIRHALLKHWNIIEKNVRLKMIFPKPPMIAYSRSENLRDSVVKAKFPTREEGDYTRMTIFWEMRKILHPHQPCKHFKIWSLRAEVSTCS